MPYQLNHFLISWQDLIDKYFQLSSYRCTDDIKMCYLKSGLDWIIQIFHITIRHHHIHPIENVGTAHCKGLAIEQIDISVYPSQTFIIPYNFIKRSDKYNIIIIYRLFIIRSSSYPLQLINNSIVQCFLISIDLLRLFYFLVFSLVLVSIEKIYQALKTVFDQIAQHFKVFCFWYITSAIKDLQYKWYLKLLTKLHREV